MIKALVFDFDEMLHLEGEFFSNWICKKYNLSKEELKKFFKNEYQECRIGKLDTKEVLKKYLPRFGWKPTVEDFMREWYEYGEMDQEMIEIIKQLRKKGVICVLSTNNEIYRMKYIIEKHKLKEIFDHLLISSELGYTKPEEKMLKKILEVTGVEKNEILFCDDKEDFIEAAKNFGFETYSYNNLEEFKIMLSEKDILK
jgi:HAD superfamily hydrolase (TIGR01509 family)